MAIGTITDGESSSSVRSKVNQAIAKANLVDAKAEQTALAAEISARQAAQSNEVLARQSGDAAVSASVLQEESDRQAADLVEALARQADIASVTAALAAEGVSREEGDAAETQAREAADGLRVKYSEAGAPFIRPGESGDFFTGALGGAPSSLVPIDDGLKVVSSRGATVRLTSGGVVAPIGIWGVEPQRQYRARFAFARSTDTEDPANDAVRVGLQWLKADKTQISLTVLADVVDITVESGRIERMFTFAAAASDVVEFVAPASAVYVRPFVRAYGSGATDIEVIEITDLSQAVDFSPDVSEFRNALAAYDARTTIALDGLVGVQNDFVALADELRTLSTETNVTVTALVAAESEARIAANAALAADINGEQAARILADNAIVGGAPGSLDTLNKIAAAIEDDPAFATTIRAYVDGIIAAQDAMVFKGVIDASANPNYPAGNRGWTYRISVAGKVGGASGKVVEVGDIIICLTDSTAAGTEAAVGAQWTVVQTNIDGAVVGPASAVDGTPMVADGTTGKLLKNITYAAFKALLVLVKGDVGLGNVANVDTTTQANVSFTGLTAAAAAADADTFPVNQGAANVKQTFAAVKTWIKSWIVKADVGLGNVDNTSNATERAAAATLQNKAIDATANTITNLALSMFASGVVDTDTTLAANSATKIAPQSAVKAYVDGIIEAANALQYKGSIDCSANPNYPAASAGHLYIVSVAGKIGGASGITVDVGDALLCKTDSTAAGDHATVGANWDILQFNLVGALTAANIGGSVQAYSLVLTAFAALAPSANDVLQFKSGAWANRTIAQLGADMVPTSSAITLSNGWTDYGGALTPAAKAWLSPDKRVTLEGTLTGGTITDGTVIGTIPAGSRPAYDQLFVTSTYLTSVATIRVKPNGQIVGEKGLNAGLTSISGISFIAA